MDKSNEDRILTFLHERGDAGAAAEELAERFLQAKGASAKIAGPIVQAMLGGDPRFNRGDDGRWRAAGASDSSSPKDETAARYTVVEFTMLPLDNSALPIEAAAVRFPPGDGRNEASTPIRLSRKLPPATRLPREFDPKTLDSAPHLAKVLEGLGRFARGTTVVSYERTAFHARVCRGEGGGRECPHLALKALARRLRLIPASADLRACAEALGVFCPEFPRAADRARAGSAILAALREHIETKIVPETDETMVEMQRPKMQSVDFTPYAFGADFLQALPELPGVYIMVDRNGMPVYVGKAKNLRARVWSYFRRRVQRDNKTERILESVHNLSVQVVGSELEALLLELQYIRELAPPINTQYSVHERHPSRQRPSDTVLILPSSAAGCAELFMVSHGEYLTQLRVNRDTPDDAEDAVREIYFSPEPPLDETDRRPEALEVLWSWLEQKRDDVSRIDIETVADAEAACRLLKAYLRDEQATGRTYRV